MLGKLIASPATEVTAGAIVTAIGALPQNNALPAGSSTIGGVVHKPSAVANGATVTRVESPPTPMQQT